MDLIGIDVNEHSFLIERGGYTSDMSNTTSLSSLVHDRGHRHHSVDIDDHGKLPFVIRITLGLLGLWFPSSQPASTPTLAIQPEQTILHMDPSTSDDEERRDSFHEETIDAGYRSGGSQNGGVPSTKYTKGCFCADVIAFIYLGMSCCVMMYDFQTYMHKYWGIKEDILHVVSYCTFLFQVMAIPLWCFYARVLYHTMNESHRRGYPLYPIFLARRIAMLNTSRFGAKGLSCFRLFCFLIWPVGNVAIRIGYHYNYRLCISPSITYELRLWIDMLGYIMYGFFCYLIYIERLSFECESRQISRFARKQERANDVDAVLKKIRLFYAHYNVLRKQAGTWMAFTMVVATWGLTAHLTLNYLIFTEKKFDPDNLPSILYLNFLITSQKIMFFFVPCLALGGLNLEHIWKRLRYDIAQNRNHMHDTYWNALSKYLCEIDVGFSRDLTSTLIFSAIGFYLGLNLGQSDQNYSTWIVPLTCNQTNITT